MLLVQGVGGNLFGFVVFFVLFLVLCFVLFGLGWVVHFLKDDGHYCTVSDVGCLQGHKIVLSDKAMNQKACTDKTEQEEEKKKV